MSGFPEQGFLELNHNANITIEENEVAEIISSIQEAQYFDASSMAPLTAKSLVSLL
jgi:hypothetical protein